MKELVFELLERMIAADTTNPPGNEAQAARYIGERLRQEGFQVNYQRVAEGRENVIASVGDSSAKEIILTGHLDVVPAGEGWKKPPFEMTRSEGKIWGRGSSDMKGAVAAMMAAAVKAAKKPKLLSEKKITLVFVCDDEVSGDGSRVFVRNYHPAKETLVIIGEPTKMQVQIAHRGISRFRVDIGGQQAHAATPEKGINPILEMSRFLLAVERFNQDRAKKHQYGILPPPVITPTILHAEVKENVIPPVCSALLDCRTVEGETEEMLRGQLTLLFLESRQNSQTTFQLETLLCAPVGTSSRESSCCRTAVQALGGGQTVGCFNGSTDMPIFTENGYRNTIICGPGSLELAHQIDEYVEEEQIRKAVDFYENFLVLA